MLFHELSFNPSFSFFVHCLLSNLLSFVDRSEVQIYTGMVINVTCTFQICSVDFSFLTV